MRGGCELPELLAVGAYLIPTLFGLGMYLTFTPQPRRLEAAAVSWAVAWATVNVVSFVANQLLAVLLDGTFYAILSAVLGVVGLVLIVRRRELLRPLLRGPFLPNELRGGFGRACLLLLAGLVAFVVYKALIVYPFLPDELIYHMALPKIAFQTGSLPIHPGLDLFDQATAYPDLLVTQQLWIYLGASAFDPTLVRLIVPVYTALLMLLVFDDSRRWFGLPAACLALGFLISPWTFSGLSIFLMDELPVAFYTYLGVHFAVEALQKGGTWYRAGLFAGFAGLVKYDAFAALLALGLALIVSSHWRPPTTSAEAPAPRWRASARKALGFYALALLPIAPIALRNSVVLGNPVYPYFLGGADAQLPPAVLAWLTNPSVSLTLWSSEAVSLLATVLVAATALGLLRIRAWSAPERLLILLVVLYLPPYLVYPLLGSQIRYLAPVIPAMAAFAGKQVHWWLSESSNRRRLLGGVLVVGFAGIAAAVVAWASFFDRFSQSVALMTLEIFVAMVALILPIVVAARFVRDARIQRALVYGLAFVLLAPGVVAVAAEVTEAYPFTWQPNLLWQSQDAYLTPRLSPDWPMWTWMNAHLSSNATVLSFDVRALYVDARIVPAMSPEIRVTENMTLAQAVAYLRSLNVGYVLDTDFGRGVFLASFFIAASPIYQNLSNTTYFQPIHSEGRAVLYAITG